MTQTIETQVDRWRHRLISAAVCFVLILPATACREETEPPAPAEAISESRIRQLESTRELMHVIATAGNELLLVEFYADWCNPCKLLAPVIEELARENLERLTVYKMDADDHEKLARSFGMRGIPYVVFIKNKTIVEALTGFLPKKTYLAAIKKHT